MLTPPEDRVHLLALCHTLVTAELVLGAEGSFWTQGSSLDENLIEPGFCEPYCLSTDLWLSHFGFSV